MLAGIDDRPAWQRTNSVPLRPMETRTVDQSIEQLRSSPPSATATRLAMGYIASQAMIVATKLGIADLLSKGALTSSEIARSTETQPDTIHRLLRALAAFDIVRDLGSGRFELTPVGDCLRVDSPNSVRPLVLLSAVKAFGSPSPASMRASRPVKTPIKFSMASRAALPITRSIQTLRVFSMMP